MFLIKIVLIKKLVSGGYDLMGFDCILVLSNHDKCLCMLICWPCT